MFYIYGKESQQFPEIKNTLADFKLKIHYWIALDEFGNIDIFKRQQNSKKHIQHILLPLKSLFEKNQNHYITPLTKKHYTTFRY